MDIDSRIGRIDAQRRAQGLSIRNLADMCRLSSSTVSRTLTGQTTPTDYTLHAMEDALGLPSSPSAEPILAALPDDPMVERYIAMQDSRIARLRAHYNMLLTEKNRWIRLLFLLCLALVLFIFVILLIDVLHPDIGWIRQQLGLTGEPIRDFLRSVGRLLGAFEA